MKLIRFKTVPLKTGVGALVVALVLGVVGWQLVARHNRLPDNAVFRLHGRVETKAMLDTRIRVLKAIYGVESPEDAKADQFRRDAAKSTAVQLIVNKEAKAHGITVAPKAAEQALSEMIAGTLAGDRATYTQFLAQAGISNRQVLDELQSIIATSDLREKIVADVKAPTEEEIQSTYTSKQKDMVSAESRRIANVVTADEASARAALSALQSGTPFARVAAERSGDGATKAKGGDLGWHTAAELEQAFGTAAFKAAKGGLFGPVQTSYGWNVGKVLGIRPGTPLTYEQVHPTLAQALLVQAQNRAWNDYLAKVIKAAHVEYADDYRPENPNGVPSDVGQTPSVSPE